MQVEHAILADYGATTSDGKLIAVGIFSTIVVESVPSQYPHMALVLRIHVHPGEAAEHLFNVNLTDPDGRPLFKVEGRFGVEESARGEGAFAQVVINMNNLRFPKAGPHSFDILIDGRLEHQVPVAVHVKNSEVPGPPPAR